MRIGICAPSTPFTRDDAARVTALAAASHPEAALVFDDQCFIEQGHFAGSDAQRSGRAPLPRLPGKDGRASLPLPVEKKVAVYLSIPCCFFCGF